MGLLVLKELGAKWMVEIVEYFADNPRIIVYGFVRAGITGVLDGHNDDEQEEESDTECKTESDFDVIEITD